MNPALKSVIVAVGDELLLGATVDTNGAWLSDHLTQLGLPVLRRLVIGDSDREIHKAVHDHVGVVSLVVFVGGLGPTPDDRTREAVAAALGLPLSLDNEILTKLAERFRAHGLGSLPESNNRQAMVPEGATVLDNRRGTAPGLVMVAQGTAVACLPGPPREFKGLFEDGLKPFLLETLGTSLPPVLVRNVHTTGIAESALADRVRELLPSGDDDVQLAFLPGLRGVDLRFTVRGRDPVEAEALIAQAQARLAPAVDRFRFEAQGGDLVEALGEAMVRQGHTLSVAESCTGGLIAQRLTSRSGASSYFLGGIIAYDNAAKEALLGVEHGTLETHGAVSEQVLTEMLQGVRGRFRTDAAIAITGIAGPDGGTPEKPVGTVWYAAALGERVRTLCRRFAGNRQAVRERSAQAALALLFDFYRGGATPGQATQGRATP